MGAILDTPEEDRLDILVALVEAFEERHFPVEPPDIMAEIVHLMKSPL